MRNIIRSCLLLLSFTAFSLTAHASILGIAGEYNVFMFDDIEQYGTDVEGRVAGGGDVTYGKANEVVSGVVVKNGFSLPAKWWIPKALRIWWVRKNVSLQNGSVGYSGNVNSGTPEYQKGVVNWAAPAPSRAMSVTTKSTLDRVRR